MGFKHRLGVTYIGIQLLVPAIANALVIEPIRIDSSQGEPLYAEIPFRNAESASPIKVSVAPSFDAVNLNLATKSNYNLYVRQNAQGNGSIVITSSTPMRDNKLDFVIKINDGSQTRVQQIRSALPSRANRLQNNLKVQSATAQTLPKINAKLIELPKYVNQRASVNLPVSSVLPTPMTPVVPLAKPTTAPTGTTVRTPTVTSAVTSPTPHVAPVVTTPIIPQTTTANVTTAATPASQPTTAVATKPMTPMPAAVQPTATPLIISTSAPPPLLKQALNTTPTILQTLQTDKAIVVQSETPTPIAENTATPIPQPTTTVQAEQPSQPQPTVPQPEAQQPTAPQPTTAAAQPQQPATAQQAAETPTQNDDGSQHVVQANESLWKISEEIAKNNNVHIDVVMRQLQEQNPEAFQNGNRDLIRQGAVLKIPSQFNITATTQPTPAPTALPLWQDIPKMLQPQAVKPSTETTALKPKLPEHKPQPGKNVQDKAATANKKADTARTTVAENAANHAKTAKPPVAKPQPPTAKTAKQPRMTVVGNPQQGTSAQGGQAKAGNGNKNTTAFVGQLMSQRLRAISLQQKVTQLDFQLRAKEQRIALLNSRLAELERQLKQRQASRKTSSNAQHTSQSQGVVPAHVAGTDIASAGLHSDSVIATFNQELV